jgi:hypothetical protein
MIEEQQMGIIYTDPEDLQSFTSLSAEHKVALAATVPQEPQTPADDTPAANSALKDKLNTAATPDTTEETQPEKTPEQIAAEKKAKEEREKWLKAAKNGPEKPQNDLGYYLNDAGDKVYTNDPVTKDMWDVLDGFAEMILAFTSGGTDLEYWHMSQDFDKRNNMTTADRYADDPIFSSKTPKPPATLPQGNTPLIDKMKAQDPEEYANTLAAAQSLLELITSTESAGRENIVNDYRSRIPSLKGDGPYTGLDAGQKTPGDLTVPNFSEKTVSEIVAWQKLYIQEQKDYVDDDFPLGIPIPIKKFPELSDEDERSAQIKKHGLEEVERSEAAKVKGVYRSSAIGLHQFTYGTLNGLIFQKGETPKPGQYIRSDEKFTVEVQERAAIGHMINTIEENKHLEPSQLMEKMTAQWKGLENVEPEKLMNILATLKKDDNLVAALQGEFKLPTPS